MKLLHVGEHCLQLIFLNSSAKRSVYLAKQKGTPIIFNNVVLNVWGIPNFCPIRVAGESDLSVQHCVAELQVIAREVPCNGNNALVEQLMIKTFPERRVFVTQTDSMKTIPELKMIYPLLFTAEALQKEYAMLMDSEPLAKFYASLEPIEEKVFPCQ